MALPGLGAVLIGGSDAEMRWLAVAVDALVEKLEVCGRARPPLLTSVHDQLAAWRRLEPSNGAGPGDVGQDEDVMTPLLLTYSEAAQVTRLSLSTIERAVRDGKLKAARFGRSSRIRPEDLEEFVAGMATRKDG